MGGFESAVEPAVAKKRFEESARVLGAIAARDTPARVTWKKALLESILAVSIDVLSNGENDFPQLVVGIVVKLPTRFSATGNALASRPLSRGQLHNQST